MRENRLPIEPKRIRMATSQVEAGYAAAMAILQSAERPDAIFSGNNHLTVGVMLALRDLRMMIPADLGLVGFDDIIWNTLVTPGITVIAQPTYEIGKTATELLLGRIQDLSRPVREVILNGQLIVRGSSAVRGL